MQRIYRGNYASVEIRIPFGEPDEDMLRGAMVDLDSQVEAAKLELCRLIDDAAESLVPDIS